MQAIPMTLRGAEKLREELDRIIPLISAVSFIFIAAP